MPNWCHNRVDIYIEDEKNIEKFLDFIKGKDEDGNELEFSFASIIPEPDYKTTPVARTFPAIKAGMADTEEEKEVLLKNEPTIKEDNWWDWRIQNWGTKWNLDNDVVINEDGNCLEIIFDTAWGPPNGIFEALRDHELVDSISWFYDEPGMQFAGYLNTD